MHFGLPPHSVAGQKKLGQSGLPLSWSKQIGREALKGGESG